MKHLFTLLLVSLFSSPLFACINEYTTDAKGDKHFTEGDNVFYKPFDNKKIIERLKEIEAELTQKYDFKLHSDYGVNLLKLGCTPEALEIFKALLLKHPKEYSIAANLGTAYELSGQNDSALKYIKRGIELKPESHFNSEWVHVKILEAKLKKISPKQIDNTTILNLGKINKKERERTAHQIYYQINERMPFTPLGDALFAKVLFETAQFVSDNHSIEEGILLYNIAETYNPDISNEVAEKITANQKLRKKYGDADHPKFRHVDLEKLKKHRPLKGFYNYKTFETK